MKKREILKVIKSRAFLAVSLSIVALGSGVGIGFAVAPNNSGEEGRSLGSLLYAADRVKHKSISDTLKKILDEPSSTDRVPALFITDGYAPLTDLSYFESAARGFNRIYGVDRRPSTEDRWFYDPNVKSAKVIGESHYTTQFKNLLIEKETAVVVAPGFNNQGAIYNWQNLEENKTNTRIKFLLIDQEARYETKILKNSLGIRSDAKEAAFKTAIYSAAYLSAIGDNDPKVGFWGGNDIPSIKNQLNGFMEGIRYWNNVITANTNSSWKKVNVVSFNSKKEFVNAGFTPGDGRSKADFLVSNGADVIFPVAGGQTADAIGAINASERSDEIKLIGVDWDATRGYPEDADLFIASISKNLDQMVYEGYKWLINGDTADTRIKKADGTYTESDNSLTMVSDKFVEPVFYFDADKSFIWSSVEKTSNDADYSLAKKFDTFNDAYTYVQTIKA